jgi:hypothetical protein
LAFDPLALATQPIHPTPDLASSSGISSLRSLGAFGDFGRVWRSWFVDGAHNLR